MMTEVNRDDLSKLARDVWDAQIERLERIGATVIETLDSGTALFISYAKSDETRFEIMIPKAGGTANESDMELFENRTESA